MDLVWLYPFSMNTLVYIEQSALGTKLNLLDIDFGKVMQPREILFKLDPECKVL